MHKWVYWSEKNNWNQSDKRNNNTTTTIPENLINSAFSRGRRPVVSQTARKDPRTFAGSIGLTHLADQLAFAVLGLSANSLSL